MSMTRKLLHRVSLPELRKRVYKAAVRRLEEAETQLDEALKIPVLVTR